MPEKKNRHTVRETDQGTAQKPIHIVLLHTNWFTLHYDQSLTLNPQNIHHLSFTTSNNANQ